MRTLMGLCVFLFVVVVVLGYGQFKTVNRLDEQNTRFTSAICTQALGVKDAYRREVKLSHTDTPARRATHKKSAAQLKATIAFFKVIVNCKHAKLGKPIPSPPS